MATAENGRNDERHRTTRVLHLLTPAPAMKALREPTAGVDLMGRHNLHRFSGETRKTLRRGISHFLSPRLQALVKEKPRIVLAEKADFAELLSEPPSGRPIQELSIDLLRRSFLIRKRMGGAASPQEEEDAIVPGRPPVPPDVPMAEQTTNKLSPAFLKKSAKRARPAEEGVVFPMQGDVKTAVKPLISKLAAMKWAGWGNPFTTVLKKSNAPARYFDYIKRPMNLTFIRDALNKNRYITVAEVEADLNLIVSNAMTFNAKTDPVHRYALELQAVFRKELPLIKRALDGGEKREEGDAKKPRNR